jgi:hypothetical protein
MVGGGAAGTSVYRARTTTTIGQRNGQTCGSGSATLYDTSSPPTITLSGTTETVYNSWSVSIPTTTDIAVYLSGGNYFVLAIECSIPAPLSAGDSAGGSGTGTGTTASPEAGAIDSPIDTAADTPAGDDSFNTGTSTSTDAGPGNFLL